MKPPFLQVRKEGSENNMTRLLLYSSAALVGVLISVAFVFAR
jgi:hypothetical protein